MISINKEDIANRFMRYVQIDTQSNPQSGAHPSTEKQKNLSKFLVEELKEIGITDAEMDEYGYVYATIPIQFKQEKCSCYLFLQSCGYSTGLQRNQRETYSA